MPLYSSAGVYIQEVDLSQIIQSESSSIGGIVGASKKGPIDRPVLINNTKQLIDVFGVPDAGVSFMHYSSLAFLEKGKQLWVRRVAGAGATYGGMALQQKAVDPFPVLVGGPVPSPTALLNFGTFAGATSPSENILAFYAIGPGSYSNNIRVGIRSDNLPALQRVTVSSSTTGGVLPSGTYEYVVTAFNSITETTASNTAVMIVTGSTLTNSNTIVWPLLLGATGYKIYGRTTAGTAALIATVGSGTTSYTDTGTIVPTVGAVPPTTVESTNQFTVNIYDDLVSATPVESFDVTLTEQLDGNGQQLEVEQKINAFSSYIRVISNIIAFVTPPVVRSIAPVYFSGGSSGAAVTNFQIAQAWLDTFSDTEAITVKILINGGYSNPIVQKAMDTLAHKRGDAMAVLDIPSNQQQYQQAIDYRRLILNLNSNRSAIYSPDILYADNYNGKAIYIPPSGHAASIYAFTDFVKNPGWQPAGLNRGILNVLGVRYPYNQEVRDVTSPVQINPIVSFIGEGIVPWEALTMQAKRSGFSFVSIRRLFDVLEVATKKFLKYSVHEPNDDFTRRQIVQSIEEYLEFWVTQRAITKYRVVADETNNPGYLTTLGQLNVHIYVEPVYPIQVIEATFILTKAGANFDYLTGF